MPLAEELVDAGVPPVAAVVMPSGTVAAVTATTSSTLLTAVELKAGINRVTGSDGVRLPNCNAGSFVEVINDTGSSIKVWPPTGGAIQIAGTSFGLAVVGTAYTQTLFSNVVFKCVVAGASSLWSVNKSA